MNACADRIIAQTSRRIGHILHGLQVWDSREMDVLLFAESPVRYVANLRAKGCERAMSGMFHAAELYYLLSCSVVRFSSRMLSFFALSTFSLSGVPSGKLSGRQIVLNPLPAYGP
jgi:hypothetical protein